MKANFVFTEAQLDLLRQTVFDRPGIEGAAFILCGQSVSKKSAKLIAHAVMPVLPSEYVSRAVDGLSITSTALTRVTKIARRENLSVVFAHSHPEGPAEFSRQDDGEEEKLLPFLQARLPGRIHGTLVLATDSIAGRIYAPRKMDADYIWEIGSRFKRWSKASEVPSFQLFDRQVRAFGTEIQAVLGSLNVGVVGLGGTGSPIAEQLCRLGVGTLTLFDGDKLDVTNVNRVYGSRVRDEGKYKVDLAKRHIKAIGLGTKVNVVREPITKEASALELRECDVIFGCTDKHLPRAILSRLALYYSIPVIDMGVLIDSSNFKISGIFGRVTTLMPGEACLFCRGRISAEAIRLENLSQEERESQVKDGYAPELDEPAPAIVPFTTATAAQAVCEFLDKLIAFKVGERESSEILLAIDRTRVRTNRLEPREGCSCDDQREWGRGDESPYMGLTWPTHTK